VDEELQEDSFIAQVDLDIFETVLTDKIRLPWQANCKHVLAAHLQDGDDITATSSDARTDSRTSVEDDDNKDKAQNEFIDLWSPQGLDLSKLQYKSRDLRPILDWLRDRLLPDIDKDARRVILEA